MEVKVRNTKVNYCPLCKVNPLVEYINGTFQISCNCGLKIKQTKNLELAIEHWNNLSFDAAESIVRNNKINLKLDNERLKRQVEWLAESFAKCHCDRDIMDKDLDFCSNECPMWANLGICYGCTEKPTSSKEKLILASQKVVSEGK